MKARITDSSAIHSLSPSDFATYLRSIGAVRIGEFRNRAAIWQVGDAEILVPKNRNIGDYSIRISEALKELSAFENRSELEIFYDISLSGFDVYRFRNASEETNSGTLPLGQSVEFLSSSKEMLLSAACSAISAKLNYPSRKPLLAEEYLGKVRMAAERGSFVLTLLAPVPPILTPSMEQLSLLRETEVTEEVPYEHLVAPMLSSGLRALDAAAQEVSGGDPSLDPFLSKAEEGLTVNLCEAVVRMHDAVKVGTIEVGITWSRNRKNIDPQDPIEINRDYIPFIREAVRSIKLSTTEASHMVKGVITHLHKEPLDEFGKVTILDFAATQPRRVQVFLNETDYQKALAAHGEGRDVEISGEVIRARRGWELKNPSGITQIDDVLEPSSSA